MKNALRLLSPLLFCAALAADASGQVVLSSVRWNLLPSQKAGRKKAEPVDSVVRPPAHPGGEPLGAVVALNNEGARPAVGVLLRYAVSAQITPIGGGKEGVWTVPFWLEETRIPQVAPGKEVRFTIRNLHLEANLRKLQREGFWPTALRIQVMTEPKSGEDLDRKIVQADLPVLWEPKAP